jgi:hypothetical protein
MCAVRFVGSPGDPGRDVGGSQGAFREGPVSLEQVATPPVRMRFAVLGCAVELEWRRHDFGAAADVAFRGFDGSRSGGPADLQYRIVSATPGDERAAVLRDDKLIAKAQEIGALLFEVQRDLVVMLQGLRSDLLFFHSSVVQRDGVATLFVAPSGSGKSTTCWGLLHQGFRYMSDELAPVDPRSMLVYPFPIALTLKSAPAEPYSLPAAAMQTARAAYVPVNVMPAGQGQGPRPIGAIFFVKYSPLNHSPQVRSLTAAEATLFLYPNLLNALAHESIGIDQAIRLVSSVPCYELASADLENTASFVASFLPSCRS